MLQVDPVSKEAEDSASPLPKHSLSRFSLVMILGALSVVSPFSIDMYLPAFDGLARELNTSVARVGLSVSSYFVGLAFGQVFYGPLLDRFGRKRPLAAGLSLYLLSTVGCIFSNNIETLIVCRFFQALGGCAAAVASTAMVRDFFPARESARIFALLVLIIGVSPLLAPTVGSLVVVVLGWKAVFALLGVLVAVTLAVVTIRLPEGHTPDPTIELRPGPIVRSFHMILYQPAFLVYSVSGALSFAGLFAYVAGSPAIFMGLYHVDAKVYGLIFAGLSVGFIGGSQVNLWLLKSFSGARIFATSLLVQTIVGMSFLVLAWTGALGLVSMLGFLFVFLSCLGLASPNATALALAPFSKNVGSAAALLGFLQMGIGALASALVGVLDLPGPFATIVALSGSAVLGGSFYLLNRARLEENADERN